VIGSAIRVAIAAGAAYVLGEEAAGVAIKIRTVSDNGDRSSDSVNGAEL